MTWTRQTVEGVRWLGGITYGDGTFVATGEYGAILTSPDLVTWTNRKWKLPSVGRFIYANDTYVAAGVDGVIRTSTDFKTWTERYFSNSLMWRIAYGNGAFIVPEYSGKLLISYDGISWAENDSLQKIGIRQLIGLTYGKGILVVVDYDRIITSPDVETWTVKHNFSWPDTGVRDVMYEDGVFVIWGSNLSPWNWKNIILISFDGETWTEIIPETHVEMEQLIYGNGMFAAVDRFGEVHTSVNGVTWVPMGPRLPGWTYGIAYGDGIFVAGGYDNVHQVGTIATSTDGVNWTPRNPGTNASFGRSVYANRTFIIYGSYGDDSVVLQSDPLVSPNLSVSLTTINFGEIPIGVSADKILTVKNIGTEDLMISNITDPLGPFLKVADNCTGQALPPGGKCEVTVRFTPLSSESFTSDFTIFSNDPEFNALVIRLTGVGIIFDLQSPAIGEVFSPCSLVSGQQPSFTWTTDGTFSGFTVLFSTSQTDFTTPIVKANISGTANTWTPSTWLWKKILTSSHNAGSPRDIYWKVIGNKSDGTKVQSETRSLRIGDRQEITINAPPGGPLPGVTPPTFGFNTNCNVKFKLEISSLGDFSDPMKIKAFNYTTRDPNVETILNKTLTSFQWSTVKKLIGTGTGYFRIKAWDGINRESVSDIRSFTIQQ
jgi:hypothetical protein